MAVIIDIKELPDGNSIQNFSLPQDEFVLDYEELEAAGDLKVSADVSKLRDQLVFQGEFIVPVKLVCARCIQQFERQIKSDLVFIVKFIPVQSEEIMDDNDDSDDFYILPEGTLEFDFQPLIRDRVILNVGLKPLCNESCRGICQSCGKDLNKEDCKCNGHRTDDRWLPLKDLTDRS
jgi:DUF177 domain-containing protein